MKKVIVIGGGPAGMSAAIAAARSGSDVMIFESGPTLGKKILSSGGGKCNLTNLKMGDEYYHTQSSIFIRDAISKFGLDETLEFFNSLGLHTISKKGYLYPRSQTAATVRTLLERMCKRSGVKLFTNARVSEENIDYNSRFIVDGYFADSLILACGGIAALKDCRNANGFDISKHFGHTIKEPLAALVPLVADKDICAALSGLRIAGKVSLFVDSVFVDSDTGEIQFTDSTISGIPVLNISGQAVRALNDGMSVYCVIDFLSEFNERELLGILTKEADLPLTDALYGFLPVRAADFIIKAVRYSSRKKNRLSEFSEADIKKIIRFLKDFKISVISAVDAKRAQTSTGGVLISEIDSATMESKIVKGLYFAGEMIDVDGICGGYNLQWAWSSGNLSGKAAAK